MLLLQRNAPIQDNGEHLPGRIGQGEHQEKALAIWTDGVLATKSRRYETGREQPMRHTGLERSTQVLVPTLRPGDVVVLDNLAAHKQPEVRPPSTTSAR